VDRAESAERPSVTYVTYDGAAEPLGVSQVVAYLERLANSSDITLISFEKPYDDLGHVRDRLMHAGVEWITRSYHSTPPVASTCWDVLVGVRALRRELRRRRIDVVHVRSYVPALIALYALRPGGPALLFDIRGFWADERVEGGIWRRGLLYQIAKLLERQFFARADAIVTLTEASVPLIRERTTGPSEIEVIPTCTATGRFAATQPRDGGPHAVWSGSLGTWYRFDLGIRLAQALELPLTVFTRQLDLAGRELAGRAADVRMVPPERR
jgi:hypothetical protein